jgi:hypothetical protein
MQKKVALSIVGITVFLTLVVMLYFVFIAKPVEENESRIPEPMHHDRHEEDESRREKREAWIEQKHAAAPGTDWRAIDHQTRKELAQFRAANYLNNGSRSDDWDTVAMGNLVGKWNEVGSFNTAGRMRATEMDFENEVIYTFSQGGNLWKGDFEGENWAVINDHFNIQSAHFLRKVDSMLIVATDAWATQSVYKTSDEGLNWSQCTGLENMTEWGYIIDVEMLNDSLRTMYAMVLEWDYVEWVGLVSLYRSDDLGDSFYLVRSFDEPTYGGSGNFAMWSPRYGSPNLYFVADDSLYQTTPADTTLLPLGSIPLTTGGTRMLTGQELDGTTTLYLATCDYYDGSQFYRYTTGGSGWTMEGWVEESYFSRASLNASHTEEGRLVFGGVDAYRSFNGGTTWTRINNWWEYYGSEANKLHADIPYIFFFNDTTAGEETLLISTDGGLYASSNYGLTNNNLTMEGMRNAQYYGIYTYRNIPDVIFAGSQDQGYQRSYSEVDNNYYFDQLISGDYGHLVSSDGGDHVWMVYPGFAMLAQDAAGPSLLYFWDFTASDALWLPPVMEDPSDPTVAWWAGGDNLYKLSFDGSNISAEQQPFDFGTSAIASIAYSPIDNNFWYVMLANGDFFRSEDGGSTWTKTIGFSGPDSHYFYGSSIIPSTTDLGTVYIGGSGYSNPAVYRSTNHGESFSAMSDGLPSTLVYDMVMLPGDSMLFAATEVAPYVFIPEEEQWYEMGGLDAPLQTYWAVEYVEEIRTVRFGTYGRGIWEFKLYEEPEPPVGITGIPTRDIMVFPNPADERLSFSVDRYTPDAGISLLSADGTLVWSRNSVALNNNVPFTLDVSQYSPGIYYLVIDDRFGREVEKVVIQ